MHILDAACHGTGVNIGPSRGAVRLPVSRPTCPHSCRDGFSPTLQLLQVEESQQLRGVRNSLCSQREGCVTHPLTMTYDQFRRDSLAPPLCSRHSLCRGDCGLNAWEPLWESWIRIVDCGDLCLEELAWYEMPSTLQTPQQIPRPRQGDSNRKRRQVTTDPRIRTANSTIG